MTFTDVAARLEDLRIPAGNRLERLKGDQAGRTNQEPQVRVLLGAPIFPIHSESRPLERPSQPVSQRNHDAGPMPRSRALAVELIGAV